MQVNKAQAQAEREQRLPTVGDYSFEVISAEEKNNNKSSDGKMLKLKLAIIDEDNGRKVSFADFIGQWENGAAKLLTFLDSIGFDSEIPFEPRELVGQGGKVHIKHGEFDGRPQIQAHYYVPSVPGYRADRNVETPFDADCPF